MSKFQVDTHLFRELGQLLVGRDSTALVELIKNAYDADATTVTVSGEALDDPKRGVIVIKDNGIGMDVETFECGFLTVASRMKEEGDRRSRRFQRRYTGAKGIGRLAAHKLARHLTVESVPEKGIATSRHGVRATIDWERIEHFRTLDEVDGKAIQVQHTLPINKPGTTITLRKLRQPWTSAQIGAFLAEVEGFQAPRALTEPLPEGLLPEEGLFERPRVRDNAQDSDPGLDVRLEGALATGDDYWPAIVQSSHWLVDIEASRNGVRYAIIPTQNKRRQAPHARRERITEKHPAPKEGPFFQARILIREGGGKKEFKAFATRVSGVRVYQEGFRVLPYGEPSDDWLLVNRDALDRSRRLRFIDNSDLADMLSPDGEGLSLLPNKHYFGAVFLLTNEVPELTILINREGFIPHPVFDRLRDIVRRGIDIATRVRAAAAEETKRKMVEGATPAHGTSGRPEPSPKPEPPQKLDHALKDLRKQADEVNAVASTLPGPAAGKVKRLVQAVDTMSEPAERLFKDVSLIRVLASVGTQLASFIHEINRLLATAQATEALARKLREDPDIGPKGRPKIAKLIGTLEDLRRAIEQQASFFGDILSPDARRKRSRLPLARQFDTSVELIEQRAVEREIQIKNEIPPELKTPPMYPAQLMAVFSNLLTNAVKAAGEKGRIRATGEAGSHGAVLLRIENTGVAVNLNEAERWFRPFESTTIEVDPVLGQGMGMGLGITRDILSEIGATIAFVRPTKGYTTAVQIDFPG